MIDVGRDLLFGLLALRSRLIDADQLIEACQLWTNCRETSLIDFLVEDGKMPRTARTHLAELVEMKKQFPDSTGHRSHGEAAVP